jgi:hypothetical protein
MEDEHRPILNRQQLWFNVRHERHRGMASAV